MNEQLQLYRGKIQELYQSFSKKQKIAIAATFLFLVISLSLFVYYASKPEMIPLFSNALSEQEVGEIKAELDSKGYTTYSLSEDGRNILVPRKDAPGLTVDLAAAGLPKGGNISLDIFSQNLGFGASDRQFDVVERDAMQNEIAKVIKGFSGVRNAQVMITLPKENLFLQEQTETATASILLDLQPGTQLNQKQINTLYHFVSKTVPNLPLENIVITDQYSQILERADQDDNYGMTEYEQQRKIKRQIESDIQRDLQNMLGTIIGRDKVFVYTYVKLNFDKVKTKANLVEAPNTESNEGIAISVEKIQKTFNGSTADPGGVSGTGATEVPGYPGNGISEMATTESEELETRVNNEVNRISKDIIESPYVIEDLTLNVGVEPPNAQDPASLGNIEQEIRKILGNVVRAALEKDNQQLTDDFINNRITVVARQFDGKPKAETPEPGLNPIILYSLAAVAVLVIAGLVIYLIRRRRKDNQVDMEAIETVNNIETDIPDLEYANDSDEVIARKQLEKLAKQRPEEFANLLRTWLQED